MRDGADHHMTVEYDILCMVTCPIRGVCARLKHDGSVPFLKIFQRPNTGTPIRGMTPISAPDIPKALHARNSGERTAFTTLLFRSEGVLTGALAGEDMPTIMQCALQKNPSTAWTDARLMKVLIAGSVETPWQSGCYQKSSTKNLTRSAYLSRVDTGRHSGTRPSYDHQRERKYGRAQFSECKTTGKGLIYVPTTKFVSHGMGPLVSGKRKHWRGKCDTILSHTTLKRNTDVKILPYYVP